MADPVVVVAGKAGPQILETVPVGYDSFENGITGAVLHFQENYNGGKPPLYRVYQKEEPNGVQIALVEFRRSEAEEMIVLGWYKIIVGKFQWVKPGPTE